MALEVLTLIAALLLPGAPSERETLDRLEAEVFGAAGGAGDCAPGEPGCMPLSSPGSWLDTPDATAPIFSMGGQLGGIGFYLKDGKPTFLMTDLGGKTVSVGASRAFTPGAQTITLELIRGKPDTSGEAPFDVTIRSDDAILAQEQVTIALPFYFCIPETFDLPPDWVSLVMSGYPARSALS